MPKECKFLALGIILAFVGFLLLILSPLNNFVISSIGIKADKLEIISIFSLISGMILTFVSARVRKKQF